MVKLPICSRPPWGHPGLFPRSVPESLFGRVSVLTCLIGRLASWSLRGGSVLPTIFGRKSYVGECALSVFASGLGGGQYIDVL